MPLEYSSQKNPKDTSTEVDEFGEQYLSQEKWQPMISGNAAQKPTSTFEKIFQKLYGDLPQSERLRVFWLAGTLFFIIGGYWLLRSLKDPIVSTINGVEYIPKCKMVSLLVVFALVFLYNKLLDLFPKHQLFYIVGIFYSVLFGLISILLAHPTFGLANTEASPYRLLGWISYCSIESFGSICVSLFWSFVNSTMNFDGAKSAYGLIIAGAQIGSVLGPTITVAYATKFGVAVLYGIGAFSMALMVIMMVGYVHTFGVPQINEKGKEKEKSAGVLEGFKLFLQFAYVRGIFALSCLFMVEVTILDYTMKVLAKNSFDEQYPGDKTASSENFAAFMGLFGQVTNTLSFAFSLLGTSFVIRRLGLRMTLLAFPTLCMGVIVMVLFVPRLTTVFFALILLKGFSYSLNNPCKEMLYQPTSVAVKFKSKSWIDIFGGRGSKALGSLVTNAFSDSAADLVHYGGGVALLMSAFLIWVADYMGKKFNEYQDDGTVVGKDISFEEARLYSMVSEEEGQDDSREGSPIRSTKSDPGVEMTNVEEMTKTVSL